MQLLYIGAGFVGACSAAVAGDSGHAVTIYDISQERIQKLGSQNQSLIESCLFEKGLSDLLIRNHEAITFTSDPRDVERIVDEVDAIFICVHTPEKPGATGESDLQYYTKAIESLSKQLVSRNAGEQSKYVVLINKSTVPIDTATLAEEILERAGVKNYGVVSNPEFLVEGKAIEGSLKPDRIVIGAWAEKDFAVMREVYQRFYNSPTTKYLEVNPKEAAAGKLLANFLLFNRLVTTYNVVGRVAEAFKDVSFENLRRILTGDDRIGAWGFFDSLYAGGSCLIKDAASLQYQLSKKGAKTDAVAGVLAGNSYQRDHFYSRATDEAQMNWENKTVAILGVAFKRDTNDVRNSPAFEIIQQLLSSDIQKIQVYDPAAMPMFKIVLESLLPSNKKIIFCDTEEAALQGSHAAFVLTDWPQFRTLAEKMVKICRMPYLLMDGRRMLGQHYKTLQEAGFDIIAVGSPFIKGKR